MASRILASRLAQRWTSAQASTVLLRQKAGAVPPRSLLPSLASPQQQPHHLSAAWFSTSEEKAKEDSNKEEEKKAEEPKNNKEGESFEETINRLSGDKGTGSSSTTDFQRKLSGFWSNVTDEVSLAWKELVASEQRKSINKKIHPVATAAGDKPYDGPVDIMVIDPSEQLTAWERMQKRLTDAPIIQDMLNRTEQIYEKSGARKAKERLDEIKEDAQEAWETSQNPWVYRASSIYDTFTAETAESIAVKELRELDPEFTLDDWKRDVVEHTLPQIMQWFLEGRINQLKDWLGDGVFKRIAAEITARQQEGVEIDTHVLGVMNSEILAVEVR